MKNVLQKSKNCIVEVRAQRNMRRIFSRPNNISSCHRNKVDRFATYSKWNGIKYAYQNLGFLLLLQKKHLVV